jgi:hypothetical protein
VNTNEFGGVVYVDELSNRPPEEWEFRTHEPWRHAQLRLMELACRRHMDEFGLTSTDPRCICPPAEIPF